MAASTVVFFVFVACVSGTRRQIALNLVQDKSVYTAWNNDLKSLEARAAEISHYVDKVSLYNCFTIAAYGRSRSPCSSRAQ